MSLAVLPKGACARVESVDRESPFAHRLVELGFVPGTLVRALGRAPLGDPMLFELRGMRLCLRQSEARRVRVFPVEAAPGAAGRSGEARG